MGYCSSLFFGVSENETLHTRISLLQKQIEYAKQKKDDLLETIKTDLREQFEVPIGHWLQGSYKNHTVIRPIGVDNEFDIDVGLYLLCNAEKEQIPAKTARDIVRDELEAYAESDTDANLRESKNCCERISFNNQFHLDIPIYYFDKNTDTCRLSTLDDEWVASDPKKLQDWFDGVLSGFDTENTARLRRVIRFAKCWAGRNSTDGYKRLPSVTISVLVASLYKNYNEDEEAVLDVFEAIADYLLRKSTVSNPVDGSDLLQFSEDDLRYLRERLNQLDESLAEVREAPDSITAYLHWSNIFGEYFPPYNIPQSESASKSTLPVHTTPPQIRVIHKLKDDKTNRSDGITDRVTTYKKEHLYFSVNNKEDYSTNARVKWMVRNKDTEANIANDLGHSKTDNIGASQYESCSYRGSHFMECLVIDNGAIRGFSSVEVKVLGIQRPLRNPPKKKIYRGPR